MAGEEKALTVPARRKTVGELIACLKMFPKNARLLVITPQGSQYVTEVYLETIHDQYCDSDGALEVLIRLRDDRSRQ